MPYKLNIIDKRMLQLPDILKNAGHIQLKKDFTEIIKMPKQNWYKITRGEEGAQHFTVAQVLIVCKKFGIDGNWILGLHNEDPFRVQKTVPAKSQRKPFLFLGKKKATKR